MKNSTKATRLKLEKTMNTKAPSHDGLPLDISSERWKHLVEVAFGLAERARSFDHSPRDESARIAAVRTALEDLLEVFPAELDPLDDLQGYALRRFCSACRTMLDAPRCKEDQ